MLGASRSIDLDDTGTASHRCRSVRIHAGSFCRIFFGGLPATRLLLFVELQASFPSSRLRLAHRAVLCGHLTDPLVYRTQVSQAASFHWIYIAFGAFIVACGFTHFMEVIVLWLPYYWLAGTVKAVTAIASVGTAIALPSLVPKTMNLVQTAKASAELSRNLEVTNRELEARNRELRRATELKSQFLASMSHELRTPLTAIMGFSDLLSAETAGPLTDKQKRYSQHILESGRHLLGLINDVLDMSKIEAGHLVLQFQTLRVVDVVNEVLTAIGPLAASKRLAVKTDIPADLKIYADRLRVRQILMNLLSNAVKFTGAGGMITVDAKL